MIFTSTRLKKKKLSPFEKECMVYIEFKFHSHKEYVFANLGLDKSWQF